MGRAGQGWDATTDEGDLPTPVDSHDATSWASSTPDARPNLLCPPPPIPQRQLAEDEDENENGDEDAFAFGV